MIPQGLQELGDLVRQSGYYHTTVEPMGDWERISLCSQRHPGGGYCGNSFWVCKLSIGWVAGTWGGFTYQLTEPGMLLEMCTTFLGQNHQYKSMFTKEFCERFRLRELDDREFDDAAGFTTPHQ